VPPARWTYAQHRRHEGADAAARPGIDWSREISACDPEYYKWNQWLFLKMLEKGIAYRKTQVVNWDPVDNTVLANEQVIDGRGWRTNAHRSSEREIPGYYLRITDYAEELLSATAWSTILPGWPERVRIMQENWIGKSEGVRFAFLHTIADASGKLIGDGKSLRLHHARRHHHGRHLLRRRSRAPARHARRLGNPNLAAFIENASAAAPPRPNSPAEKEGHAHRLMVIHPLTGEMVPVWVGNYVLMSYGDGAVMGVPAHDERDFAFAKKYGCRSSRWSA
jgi:leucyl-tRNA synthetase